MIDIPVIDIPVIDTAVIDPAAVGVAAIDTVGVAAPRTAPPGSVSELVAAVDGPRPRAGRKYGRETDTATLQRKRLIGAILLVVSENGYEHATIGDIVSRAKVSRATFYTHFADKEECYVVAFTATIRRLWSSTVRAADPAEGSPATPESVFVRSIDAFLDAAFREPAVTRSVYAATSSGGRLGETRKVLDEKLARNTCAYFEYLRTQSPALAERTRPLTFEAALAANAGVNALMVRALEHPGGTSIEALRQEVLLTFMSAVSRDAVDLLGHFAGPCSTTRQAN